MSREEGDVTSKGSKTDPKSTHSVYLVNPRAFIAFDSLCMAVSPSSHKGTPLGLREELLPQRLQRARLQAEGHSALAERQEPLAPPQHAGVRGRRGHTEGVGPQGAVARGRPGAHALHAQALLCAQARGGQLLGLVPEGRLEMAEVSLLDLYDRSNQCNI